MGKLYIFLNCLKLFLFASILAQCLAKNLTTTRFTVKLENYENLQYFGSVLVGSQNSDSPDSKKNKFNVIFSTGTSLTWLPGDKCVSCRNDSNKYVLKGENNLNITEYSFKYSIGEIKGNFVYDTIQINDHFRGTEINPAKINDFKFLMVNYENENLQKLKADGVIGLGLTAFQEESNFIDELYKSGVITAPKFSFYFSSGSFLDSKLYLGDFTYNTPISPIYKQLNYCKVTNNLKQWGCELNSIQIEKTTLPIISNFVLDTGSSYVVIPISDFKIIKKYALDSVNAQCVRSETNQLLCKCDTPNIFPSIKLFIGGEKNLFKINLVDLIDYAPSFHYECRFHILVEMENLDTWTIGTAAMRNVFFSFDMLSRKIGFAQNPKNIETYVTQPFIVETEPEDSNKLAYIFALIFMLVLMYGMYRCANNDKFMNRSRFDSFGDGSEDEKMKVELIKNKFNAEEYDYDVNLDVKNKTKYVEMKEVKTDINNIEK